MHPGPGGLACLDLYASDAVRARVAHARAFEHGAHVTAWTPAGENESRLFLSSASAFGAGKAIRGGVPVVFPQFSDRGPYGRHGFARTAAWTLVGATPEPDRSTFDGSYGEARFRLGDTPETRAAWPFAFVAEVGVRVEGRTLTMAFTAENTGTEPFAFTAALHTYLAVSDTEAARVEGLAGAAYEDNAAAGARRVDGDAAVAFAGGREVDRLYLGVPGPVCLVGGPTPLRVEQTGFEDVVVWNPGREKGEALADLGPGEWARFVCVEAAQVGRPVRLAPGEAWTGRQRLVAR